MKPILSSSSLSHPFIKINPLQFSLNSHLSTNQNLIFLSLNHISHPIIPITKPLSLKSDINHQSNPSIKNQEDGIPTNYAKILVKFKSRYDYIRVLEVSRKADHPFRCSRLLLLDNPGNIHSINFLIRTLTDTYFDIFATLPPILPPGPIGVLGFGAGSDAIILLELYPEIVIHGWEIDPSVIDVGTWERVFLSLENLKNNVGREDSRRDGGDWGRLERGWGRRV